MKRISVARGGGGGCRGAIAPPPNKSFSEFCRYIWKFVGTCKPTSIVIILYRQSIWSTDKILKEIAVLECKNAKIT